jgi:hypothetical protein
MDYKLQATILYAYRAFFLKQVPLWGEDKDVRTYS